MFRRKIVKIVLATGNKGKIKEFQSLVSEYEIIAYKDLIGDFEVEENQDTFKGNAIKKAQEIYDELTKNIDEDFIVISDDSGISVPFFNNEPGVYSARYAGINSSDEENNEKLINKLNKNKITKTPAFYTACIAIVHNNQVYTVHGWMHGNVINKQLGNEGFGYDPMFIPNGYEKTLGELPNEVKKDFSHRSKALNLAKKILEIII